MGDLQALPDEITRCMLYIVHRTQLYLDHDVYRALSAVATRQRKTLSEVIRERMELRSDLERGSQRKLGAQHNSRSTVGSTER